MGNLNVTKLSRKKDKANYIHQLSKDIQALDYMLENDMIEKSPIRIGAEQEFCLVNDEFLPNNNSLQVLKEINDDHFTTEIGNYNLEANLDPFELTGDCFSKVHKQLKSLMDKAKSAAEKYNTKIILTGILPTLSLKHISIDNMTPIQRYYVLNDAIKESRLQHFDIHIKGVDELNLLHDSVMLEGCNTSFQSHLQIDPDNFIRSYNWAQAISGPILSACTNSPFLFGKELWSETRIALFTQSVDTRTNSFLLNEKQSRVSFGSDWERGSVSDIFKDNISRFRSLLTAEFESDSIEVLKDGNIPKLKALSLHNGTVYRWNRVCYGVGGGKPHLRIENRYIPSGPTMKDEIANMMFWVGVMVGRPKEYDNIHEVMDFKDVKTNFFAAARYGLASQFIWEGKTISSQELILDVLLPMAYRGLYKMGVTPRDVENYLTVIENRVRMLNGSQWLSRSYRNLLRSKRPNEALQVLTANLYLKQEHDYPVATWEPLNKHATTSFDIDRRVRHMMNTDVFTVDKKDSLELVINIMRWKNIHHMPVIDDNKDLVGLLSWTDIVNNIEAIEDSTECVQHFMKEDLITINKEKCIHEAQMIMQKNNINCLPVVKGRKLIGILTSNDF
ncbi:CBS domain-containing protein [Psychroserpens sp.]|uniref:CBS domain-containing protein n=1 Tax=Psychroserpens sp. TaxID=2020870 RepID=UPI001B220B79|nr:CBS domain-containing protein [Psychroserpens sp.]MBO6605338.1 CBS domain-containing protein [Psychroserpens sp.]MBO6629979.1 CBS domain-containing protein [Psychroserpens sp.]MBO6653853.1 CBS domain-containing protein [Psychroserpens sp.]MBO6682174.1 CBS domain-containing protein [Psychroserpens sp.]MBO6748712.1 CBS domain-containing protein [Psychroserpens sp.]